jgi:plasmid stabilization system protein ParE
MSWFTVEWTRTAENELADIWNNATDRRAVSIAQDRIDRLLGASPLTYGSDVAEGLRRLTVAPLTVYYSVHPTDRKVEVSDVRSP